jgi:membrane associated rhomboid family serine protease
MVWGIFPASGIDISWEVAMFGSFAGVVLAVLFSSEGRSTGFFFRSMT